MVKTKVTSGNWPEPVVWITVSVQYTSFIGDIVYNRKSHNTTNEIVFTKTTYDNFANVMIHRSSYYGN